MTTITNILKGNFLLTEGNNKNFAVLEGSNFSFIEASKLFDGVTNT